MALIIRSPLPKIQARSSRGMNGNKAQLAPRKCQKTTPLAQSWPKLPKTAILTIFEFFFCFSKKNSVGNANISLVWYSGTRRKG